MDFSSGRGCFAFVLIPARIFHTRRVGSLQGEVPLAVNPRGEEAMNTHDPQVLRVDGVLDVETARRLALALSDAGAGEIRIDLTRVREFHDFGVAVLARALADRRAPTAVSGLRQHHLRLLRYLGIETGQLDVGREAEAV
jgi:ABC-type transporter Mla MlaB component